jgi:hypothetical protein
MAVIQPLYFPGGRYAASTDRKLLAAFIPSEADGTRVSGVVPSYYGTKSMKVTSNSSMTLSVQPGVCIIPDKATQSADSPGFYLGAVDTSSESVIIAPNSSGSTRTDSIYAVVDDTPYTITNKELSSNVATITTSTAHGFVGGQTVVITGVDNTFDGSYVIRKDAPDAPTTYTFKYTKTADNVASTAVVANATSYVAGASVKTITNKVLASNIATLTAASHGFSIGSIVTVRGVDSVFDGSYEISAVTTDTFSYVKVARAVGTTPISNSYSGSAVARVPFAIKVETGTGTTLSSKTKILLAKVSVANGLTISGNIAQSSITDYRQYVTSLGGVHIYDTNSSATGPAGVDGRLRWQTNSTGPTGGVRKLEVYDGVDSAWRAIYNTAGNHHDDETTDASTTAIHHTIGTSATQAAAGNHTHTPVDDGSVNYSSADENIGSTSSTNYTVLQTDSITLTRTTDVLVIATDSYSITDGTGGTFYMAITRNAASGGTLYGQTALTGLTGVVPVTCVYLFKNLSAGTQTFRVVGYKSTSGVTGVSVLKNMSIIPIK